MSADEPIFSLLSLDDLLWSHSFKVHLYVDNTLIYISCSDLFACCLLSMFMWMSNSHLNFNQSQNFPLIPTSVLATPTLQLLASKKLFSFIPHTLPIKDLIGFTLKYMKLKKLYVNTYRICTVIQATTMGLPQKPHTNRSSGFYSQVLLP